MDIERAKELLPIIQAFAEGKKIELALFDDDGAISEWSDVHFPKWLDNHIYRIKPEPKYRPFEYADECWDEMQKHEPLGWLKMKSNDEEKVFLFVRGIHKYIKDNSNTCDICIDDDWESSIYIFGEYTFADGTPFGVKEEE